MFSQQNCIKKSVLFLSPVIFILTGLSQRSIADIGLVNTKDLKVSVLYEDDGKVFIKNCETPVTPPLSRECVSTKSNFSIDMTAYLAALPYDVGSYPKTEAGLKFAQKALNDALKNGASKDVVQRLRAVTRNLKVVVEIPDNLDISVKNVTYYEYQAEFIKLQQPFQLQVVANSMNFVAIASGSFFMGSPNNEPHRFDTETQHEVVISNDFEMQTTEVTQEQWVAVMGYNPSHFKHQRNCPSEFKVSGSVPMCPKNPVENVSWNDVQSFIGKFEATQSKYRYRLPTEAQWEYAARAETEGPYSVEGPLKGFAWYNETSARKTHPVGQLSPNAWGLYDVHGNVWEWVGDYFGKYPSSLAKDPKGATFGTHRGVRGGAWSSNDWELRSAARGNIQPNYRYTGVGFRLVRTLK